MLTGFYLRIGLAYNDVQIELAQFCRQIEITIYQFQNLQIKYEQKIY